MNRFTISVILISLIPISLCSIQYHEIASAYFQHSPSYNSNKSSLSNMNLNFTVPIKFNQDYLITGAGYDYLVLYGNDRNLSSINLNDAFIKLGYLSNIENNSNLTIFTKLNYSSDFKDLISSDLKYSIAALYTEIIDDELKFSYGISYRKEFSSNELWVFFRAQLLLSKYFGLDLLFPRFVIMKYLYSDVTEFGISINTTLDSYGLEQDNSSKYAEFINPHIFIFMKYLLFNNFLLDVSLGHSFLRSLRIYDLEDKFDLNFSGLRFGNFRQIEQEYLSNSAFFKVKLCFVIPRKQ